MIIPKRIVPPRKDITYPKIRPLSKIEYLGSHPSLIVFKFYFNYHFDLTFFIGISVNKLIFGQLSQNHDNLFFTTRR
jgi:hypothetical protein